MSILFAVNCSLEYLPIFDYFLFAHVRPLHLRVEYANDENSANDVGSENERVRHIDYQIPLGFNLPTPIEKINAVVDFFIIQNCSIMFKILD